ncbi:MAG TPA: lipocalin family protein [Solimonas sp.]|nr:lipocalin family protein [Solimonas sp.]
MLRLIAAALILLSSACANRGANLPPIPTVDSVDLPRYMGTWYPIANIPPWPETRAHDSVEHYRLAPDGSIPTTFTYRDRALDGPVETLESTGYVVPGTGNAEWGVQFVWPFRAEYLVAWLAPDYSQVIIARNKRDYVWYMARTPQVSEADYQAAVERIGALGYDLTQLRRVPRPPAARP